MTGKDLIPIMSGNCGIQAMGFEQIGRLEDEFHAQAYDLVYFNFNGGQPMSDWVDFPSCEHTGFIYDRDGNTIYCIEGNYGGGNGSYGRTVRSLGDVSCVAHPKYNDQITGKMVYDTYVSYLGKIVTEDYKDNIITRYYDAVGSDWCAYTNMFMFEHTKAKEPIDMNIAQIYGKVCGFIDGKPVWSRNFKAGEEMTLGKGVHICGYMLWATNKNGEYIYPVLRYKSFSKGSIAPITEKRKDVWGGWIAEASQPRYQWSGCGNAATKKAINVPITSICAEITKGGHKLRYKTATCCGDYGNWVGQGQASGLTDKPIDRIIVEMI